MKKHFLRAIMGLLVACLGIGALAACGGGEPNPPDTTYTIAFSLGESHAAAGVTAPASQTGKAVGDSIALTAPDAAKDWRFDGWYTVSGKVNGTTYTVAAADAVGSTITLTAHWAEDGEPAADSIEGVWTNETVTLTVENNRAVMKTEEGNEGAEYCYFELTEADGYYSCGEDIRFTLTETGLIVQIPSVEEGQSTQINFTTHTQDLTHVTIAGTYDYVVTDEYGTTNYTIDFTNHTVAEGTGTPEQVSFIQVGEYTIADIEQFLSLPIGDLSGVLVVFKSGSQVYAGTIFKNVILGDKAVELQAAD